MLIGNGMVARVFSKLLKIECKDFIFASGVSNSCCSDENQFSRERKLLVSSLKECPDTQIFLYFSTCSIYDPDAQSSPYVVHKSRMEEYVLGHPGGQVIRLPQLAGPNAPASTLISFLVSKVRAKAKIIVWENAYRNVIDIDHAALIVNEYLLGPYSSERIINVANPYSVSVMQLVKHIEFFLGIEASINAVSRGDRYFIDISHIRPVIQSLGIAFGDKYIHNVLRKYYS